MNKALLLIDIQNFYFYGKAPLKDPVPAGLNAKRLLERFRERGLPVIHIKHDTGDDRLSVEGKVLSDIHECVTPKEGEAVLIKKTPGSFKGTPLNELLKDRGVDELVICGMMSHMCVDTTTREAFDLDYKCTVAHDACTTRNLEFNGTVVPAGMVHAASMAALGYRFARVADCGEILNGL